MGAFQRRSAWRAARSRWDVLAEHAALAIVFADFPRVRRTSARSDVPVTGTAMSAEWAVICDAPAWRACLVGVESATTRGARTWPRRTFRAMWSMEPAVVRDAARLAVTIAAQHAPEIADVAAPLLRARPAVPDDALRDASVLTTRVLENVLRVARRAVT